MNSPHLRAPHSTGAPGAQPEAPNAALLIDFDNVTMGMRSDLSKELRTLLNSDIIKGKVTVQRAYADWRRYPQYIVPLSENSVDLIFAPAYGSSKKNATDIRMAIDAIELVFIRPEIGTFILLTGDSDFSSLVLKLKEYGKYVIGVGIQESSSDILVQNCDEYYSYTSITGLKKTTEATLKPIDPWVLVEKAVERMVTRDDVMRSDRLKQVMLELDSTFDEGNYGFSKFSRFLSEAAARKVVKLRKLENGQYQVQPPPEELPPTPKPDSPRGGRIEESRAMPDRGRAREPAGKAKSSAARTTAPRTREPEKKRGEDPTVTGVGQTGGGDEADPLKAAYDLLREALGSFDRGDGALVRDSDLKRKMLEINSSFDEGELGFGKFSRFLRQAHDHEVVDLTKQEEGSYQVSAPSSTGRSKEGAAALSGDVEAPGAEAAPEALEERVASGPSSDPVTSEAVQKEPVLVPQDQGEGMRESPRVGLRLRRGERGGRRREDESPPPLFEGQVVGKGPATSPPRTRRGRREQVAEAKAPHPGGQPPVGDLDAAALGLPADEDALVRYLANSYKGVGEKTAATLVKAFGTGIYAVMQQEPERIAAVIPSNRAEKLLSAWRADLERRRQRLGAGEGEFALNGAGEPPPSRRRTRRGGRKRDR